MRRDAEVGLEIRTLAEAKHSGAAPDALIALVHALATLHDEHGNVAVAGQRCEDVQPPATSATLRLGGR